MSTATIDQNQLLLLLFFEHYSTAGLNVEGLLRTLCLNAKGEGLLKTNYWKIVVPLNVNSIKIGKVNLREFLP